MGAFWRGRLLVVMASLMVAACDAPDKAARSAEASASEPASAPPVPVELEPDGLPKRYSVVPYGYNYTDTYIDSFEVNGAGGGNLEVSIPTAGGGGHTCCMTLVSGLPIGYEFKVTWTRDRQRWCHQTVRLTKPVPPEPKYFEVHFYEDGHIEVEATQHASSPRLQLDRVSYARRHETGNVDNDAKFARCTDGHE